MSVNSKGGIPEEIEIDGKTIKVKENQVLLDLIKGVRKQEKSKLYSQIEELETEVEKLGKKSGKTEDEKDTLSELRDELKELRKELKVKDEELTAAAKGADKDKGADEDKKSKDKALAGLTAEDVKKLLDDALAKKDEEYEKKIASVKGELDGKKLADYRDAQLAKYEGRIIKDLVPTTGFKTQEELDAALQNALTVSKQYIREEYEAEDGKKEQLTIAEIEARQKEEREQQKQRTQDYTPPKPPGSPEQGDGDVSKKDLLKNVADMSDEEYEKYRGDILRQAKEVPYTEN